MLRQIALTAIASLISAATVVRTTTATGARSLLLLFSILPVTVQPLLHRIYTLVILLIRSQAAPPPPPGTAHLLPDTSRVDDPPYSPAVRAQSSPRVSSQCSDIPQSVAVAEASISDTHHSEDEYEAPVAMDSSAQRKAIAEPSSGTSRPLYREPSVWDWAPNSQKLPYLKQQPVASSALVELGAASVYSSDLSSTDSDSDDETEHKPSKSAETASCMQKNLEASVDLCTSMSLKDGSVQDTAESPVPFAEAPSNAPYLRQRHSEGIAESVFEQAHMSVEWTPNQDEVMKALVAAGMMSPNPPLPDSEASVPETQPVREAPRAATLPRVPGGRLQGLFMGACRAVRGIAAVARASVAGGEVAAAATDVLLSPAAAIRSSPTQVSLDALSPPPLPSTSLASSVSPVSKVTDWDEFCTSVVAGGEPVLPLPPMLNIPRLGMFCEAQRDALQSFALKHGLTPRSQTPRLRLTSPRSFFLTEAELRSARTPRVSAAPPKEHAPTPPSPEVQEGAPRAAASSTGFRFGAGAVSGGLRAVRGHRLSDGARCSGPWTAPESGTGAKRSFQEYVDGATRLMHGSHARRSFWRRDGHRALQDEVSGSKLFKAHCMVMPQ